MKKYFALLITVLIIISLVGCQDNGDLKDTDTPESTLTDTENTSKDGITDDTSNESHKPSADNNTSDMTDEEDPSGTNNGWTDNY